MSSKKITYSSDFKLKVLDYYFKHGGDDKFGLKKKTAGHFNIDKKTVNRMLNNPDMVKRARKHLAARKVVGNAKSSAASTRQPVKPIVKKTGGSTKASSTSNKTAGSSQSSASSSSTSNKTSTSSTSSTKNVGSNSRQQVSSSSSNSNRTTPTKPKSGGPEEKNSPGVEVFELPEDPDYSLLKLSINAASNGVAGLAKLLVTGTEEVRNVVLNECDVILECKVCRNLFRSVVNFLAHKRIYCQEEFADVRTLFHKGDVQGVTSQSNTIVVEPEPPPENENFNPTRTTIPTTYTSPMKPTAQARAGRSGIDSIALKLARKRKAYHASSSTHVGSSSYFRSISEVSRSRDKLSRDCSVVLEDIGGVANAVFQTYVPPGSASPSTSMSVMIDEASHSKSGVSVAINQNGDIVKTAPGDIASMDVDQPSSSSDSRDLTCLLCNTSFATQKTLSVHQRSHHGFERCIYYCPICQTSFLSMWAVVKHLQRTHKKSKNQIERLRKVVRKNVRKKMVYQNAEKKNIAEFEKKMEEPLEEKVEEEDSNDSSNKTAEVISPKKNEVSTIQTSPAKASSHKGWRSKDGVRWMCNVCRKMFITRVASLAHVATHIVCSFEPKAVLVNMQNEKAVETKHSSNVRKLVKQDSSEAENSDGNKEKTDEEEEMEEEDVNYDDEVVSDKDSEKGKIEMEPYPVSKESEESRKIVTQETVSKLKKKYLKIAVSSSKTNETGVGKPLKKKSKNSDSNDSVTSFKGGKVLVKKVSSNIKTDLKEGVKTCVRSSRKSSSLYSKENKDRFLPVQKILKKTVMITAKANGADKNLSPSQIKSPIAELVARPLSGKSENISDKNVSDIGGDNDTYKPLGSESAQGKINQNVVCDTTGKPVSSLHSETFVMNSKGRVTSPLQKKYHFEPDVKEFDNEFHFKENDQNMQVKDCISNDGKGVSDICKTSSPETYDAGTEVLMEKPVGSGEVSKTNSSADPENKGDLKINKHAELIDKGKLKAVIDSKLTDDADHTCKRESSDENANANKHGDLDFVCVKESIESISKGKLDSLDIKEEKPDNMDSVMDEVIPPLVFPIAKVKEDIYDDITLKEEALDKYIFDNSYVSQMGNSEEQPSYWAPKSEFPSENQTEVYSSVTSNTSMSSPTRNPAGACTTEDSGNTRRLSLSEISLGECHAIQEPAVSKNLISKSIPSTTFKETGETSDLSRSKSLLLPSSSKALVSECNISTSYMDSVKVRSRDSKMTTSSLKTPVSEYSVSTTSKDLTEGQAYSRSQIILSSSDVSSVSQSFSKQKCLSHLNLAKPTEPSLKKSPIKPSLIARAPDVHKAVLYQPQQSTSTGGSSSKTLPSSSHSQSFTKAKSPGSGVASQTSECHVTQRKFTKNISLTQTVADASITGAHHSQQSTSSTALLKTVASLSDSKVYPHSAVVPRASSTYAAQLKKYADSSTPSPSSGVPAPVTNLANPETKSMQIKKDSKDQVILAFQKSGTSIALPRKSRDSASSGAQKSVNQTSSSKSEPVDPLIVAFRMTGPTVPLTAKKNNSNSSTVLVKKFSSNIKSPSNNESTELQAVKRKPEILSDQTTASSTTVNMATISGSCQSVHVPSEVKSKQILLPLIQTKSSQISTTITSTTQAKAGFSTTCSRTGKTLPSGFGNSDVQQQQVPESSASSTPTSDVFYTETSFNSKSLSLPVSQSEAPDTTKVVSSETIEQSSSLPSMEPRKSLHISYDTKGNVTIARYSSSNPVHCKKIEKVVEPKASSCLTKSGGTGFTKHNTDKDESDTEHHTKTGASRIISAQKSKSSLFERTGMIPSSKMKMQRSNDIACFSYCLAASSTDQGKAVQENEDDIELCPPEEEGKESRVTEGVDMLREAQKGKYDTVSDEKFSKSGKSSKISHEQDFTCDSNTQEVDKIVSYTEVMKQGSSICKMGSFNSLSKLQLATTEKSDDKFQRTDIEVGPNITKSLKFSDTLKQNKAEIATEKASKDEPKKESSKLENKGKTLKEKLFIKTKKDDTEPSSIKSLESGEACSSSSVSSAERSPCSHDWVDQSNKLRSSEQENTPLPKPGSEYNFKTSTKKNVNKEVWKMVMEAQTTLKSKNKDPNISVSKYMNDKLPTELKQSVDNLNVPVTVENVDRFSDCDKPLPVDPSESKHTISDPEKEGSLSGFLSWYSVKRKVDAGEAELAKRTKVGSSSSGTSFSLHQEKTQLPLHESAKRCSNDTADSSDALSEVKDKEQGMLQSSKLEPIIEPRIESTFSLHNVKMPRDNQNQLDPTITDDDSPSTTLDETAVLQSHATFGDLSYDYDLH